MNVLKIEVLRELRKTVDAANDDHVFLCVHIERIQRNSTSSAKWQACADLKDAVLAGINGRYTFGNWLARELLAQGGPIDHICNEVWEPFLNWRTDELLLACRLAWVDRMLADCMEQP